MFEKASRMKFRFSTSKGELSAEDLWDLPLRPQNGRVHLDEIARELNKKLKSSDDVSFVSAGQKSDEVTQLKFDIAYHIIKVRLAEEEAAMKSRENDAEKQRLLGIYAQRKNAADAELSIEELEKKINALN